MSTSTTDNLVWMRVALAGLIAMAAQLEGEIAKASAAERDGKTAPVAPAPRLKTATDAWLKGQPGDEPAAAAEADVEPVTDAPVPRLTQRSATPYPPAFEGDTYQMRRVREAVWRIHEPRFTTDDIRRAGGFGASNTLKQVMTKGVALLVANGELVRIEAGRGLRPGVYRRGDKLRRGPSAAAPAATEVVAPRPVDATARPRFAGETMPINPMRQVAVDDTPTLATAVGIPAGRRGAVA